MRNTLDTIETPGRVLTSSNAGRIVSAVVCVAPRDHPVGHPQRDHHRAEVGDVGDDVARLRRRVTPLCARRARVLGGEALDAAPGRAGRARARRTGRRRAATAAPRTSSSGPSSVSSTTRRRSSDLGRPQDPLVGPLGQHDVPRGRARAVEQRVLEHQRRDRLRARRRRCGRAGRRRRRGSRTAPAPW